MSPRPESYNAIAPQHAALRSKLMTPDYGSNPRARNSSLHASQRDGLRTTIENARQKLNTQGGNRFGSTRNRKLNNTYV